MAWVPVYGSFTHPNVSAPLAAMVSGRLPGRHQVRPAAARLRVRRRGRRGRLAPASGGGMPPPHVLPLHPPPRFTSSGGQASSARFSSLASGWSKSWSRKMLVFELSINSVSFFMEEISRWHWSKLNSKSSPKLSQKLNFCSCKDFTASTCGLSTSTIPLLPHSAQHWKYQNNDKTIQ